MLYNCGVQRVSRLHSRQQSVKITRNHAKRGGGGVNSKVWKQALPFLYATHYHNLLCITVKCYENVPKDKKLYGRTNSVVVIVMVC